MTDRFWRVCVVVLVISWFEVISIAAFGGRDMIQPGRTRMYRYGDDENTVVNVVESLVVNLSGFAEFIYPLVLGLLVALTAALVVTGGLPALKHRAAAGFAVACAVQAAFLMPLIGTRAVHVIGGSDYDELRSGEGVIISMEDSERWDSFEQVWLHPNQIAPVLLATVLVTVLVTVARNDVKSGN
jgi:ABC-type glycerol-3-phosphate transport system permease component